MRTKPRARGSWWWLAAMVLIGACAKKSAPATATPTQDADGLFGAEAAGAAPLDSDDGGAQEIDELTAALAGYEDELLAAGIEVQGREAEVDRAHATPMAQDAPRCTRVCELADAICELQANICSLADAHDDETRYVDVCVRAGDACQRAAEACSACSVR